MPTEKAHLSHRSKIEQKKPHPFGVRQIILLSKHWLLFIH